MGGFECLSYLSFTFASVCPVVSHVCCDIGRQPVRTGQVEVDPSGGHLIVIQSDTIIQSLRHLTRSLSSAHRMVRTIKLSDGTSIPAIGWG